MRGKRVTIRIGFPAIQSHIADPIFHIAIVNGNTCVQQESFCPHHSIACPYIRASAERRSNRFHVRQRRFAHITHKSDICAGTDKMMLRTHCYAHQKAYQKHIPSPMWINRHTFPYIFGRQRYYFFMIYANFSAFFLLKNIFFLFFQYFSTKKSAFLRTFLLFY